MSTDTVHAAAHENAQSDFEGSSLQLSAAPPTFQLQASTVIQRDEGDPSPLVEQLHFFRFTPPYPNAFWSFFTEQIDAINADPTAVTWLEQHLSEVEMWRARNTLAHGAGNFSAWGQDEVQLMIDHARTEIPPIEDVRAYLSREDVETATKLRILGQMKADIGQVEFLLNRLYFNGSQDHEEGPNAGHLVNDYLAANNASPAGNRDWCTMFNGYIHQLIGFNEQLVSGDLIFWSNSRLNSWQVRGLNYTDGEYDPDNITAPNDFENYTGAGISQPEWATLTSNLRAHHQAEFDSEEAREAALDQVFTDFFADRPTPMPGDVMTINHDRDGAFDHTVMVEAYNSATHRISTVEGNTNGSNGNGTNGVGGRVIDLEGHPDTGGGYNAANMTLLVRAGLELYQEPEPEAAEAEGAEGETEGQAETTATADTEATVPQVTATDLMMPIVRVKNHLRDTAQAEGLVGSGTTVAEMDV